MRGLSPVLLCAALVAVAELRPAGAESPSPTGSGADTARVHLGAPGTGSEAFVAWPDGRGPAPAIVVLHEWWGLDAHVREVAHQFARQGYVAVVPDLYHGLLASDPERARQLKDGLDPADAFATIDGAIQWLRGQPRTARARVGVVGFCMGGGIAERYALRARGLDAVVMFYGQPETDPAALAGLTAPLQGHFGAEDASIPLAKVDELRVALAKAGKSAEIHTYPGAGHAFMHEGRDTYRPDASRQAWARMLGFLQQHLKGR
jgi:carboxymethylenebutenolidase